MQPVDPKPLCPTCNKRELHQYILAGKPAESFGCSAQWINFPEATRCESYQREPGSDDA